MLFMFLSPRPEAPHTQFINLKPEIFFVVRQRHDISSLVRQTLLFRRGLKRTNELGGSTTSGGGSSSTGVAQLSASPVVLLVDSTSLGVTIQSEPPVVQSCLCQICRRQSHSSADGLRGRDRRFPRSIINGCITVLPPPYFILRAGGAMQEEGCRNVTFVFCTALKSLALALCRAELAPCSLITSLYCYSLNQILGNQ